MKHDSNQWISISDMMSGLMLVFLFISVAYMIEVEQEKEKMKSIAIAYNQGKKELNSALKEEFAKDLAEWNAEILDNNTIRFKSPDILFETGKSDIKDKFKYILDDFFPRYINILTNKKFRLDIDEIRIEGHTSSDWGTATNRSDRYIHNAKLSQDRAFQVLNYCINVDKVQKELDWLIKLFRANGVSFANPIIVDGVENAELSRRVEFRVITKMEDRIYKIIEAGQ
jgi:outer membrane protein OmpA-like peptidoglycan-associated protein